MSGGGALRRERLERLKSRLVAAHLRSRSIRLPRTTRSGALDLCRLDAVAPKAFAELRRRLGQGKKTAVALVGERSSGAEGEVARDLATLARAARAAWQESGAEELSVGWPFLEGKSADGTWVRGPLLFFPARLSTTTRGRRRWELELEGPPDLNEPLAQTLRRVAGFDLTLDDVLEADDDKDLRCDEATFADLARCLRSLGLSLDEAEAAVRPFPALDKAASEALPADRFRLHSYLVLGRFPRAGSTIALEYDALLEGDPDADLDDASLGAAADILAIEEEDTGEQTPPSAPEEPPLDAGEGLGLRRWQVLPSDGSQDEVFRFFERPSARGLVVQGPPGTGKSQLLANLVAARAAAGDRVLLVCQKRAALDVVAERLAHLGLGELAAVVHDTERDRAEVCRGLVGSLRPVLDDAARPAHPALAARDHARAALRLEHRVAAADEAFRRLARSERAVPSVIELDERRLQSAVEEPIDLLRFAADVDEPAAHAALPRLDACSRETEPLAAPHPLHRRESWAGLTDEELGAAFAAVRRARSALDELAARDGALSLPRVVAKAGALREARALLDVLGDPDGPAAARLCLFWAWTGGEAEGGLWRRTMARLEAARDLAAAARGLVRTSSSTLVDWEAKLGDLLELEGRVVRFFLPRFWRARRAPAAAWEAASAFTETRPSRALVEAGAEPGPSSALDEVRRARAWQELIDELPADHRFLEIGLDGSHSALEEAIAGLAEDHDLVLALHRLAAELRGEGAPFDEPPDLGAGEPTGLWAAVVAEDRRLRAWEAFSAALEGAAGALDEQARTALSALVEGGELDAARDLLTGFLDAEPDAAEARRVDELLVDEPAWAIAFLRHWRGAPGQAGGDALVALEDAWRRHHLGGRDPHVLEASLVGDEHLAAVGRDLDRCREEAARAVLTAVRGRLAEAAAGDEGRLLRRLLAEASKQRRRMTLRKLIEELWPAVARVRPVWLCSPESVAALFPLEPELFDLVVFDEASQCPVESSVGALVRAKQVLVAGDDQQMPPSHFFQTRQESDDDEEESGVLASASVLALARVAFPSTTLRWHYRSRHEELVAFSNAAFYGRRLVTAPEPDDDRGPAGLGEGLAFVPVDGRWRGNVNQAEADAVVEHLGRLLAVKSADDGRPPTLGVVCFNQKQAELVEETLEARAADDADLGRLLAADRERPAIEQLFVRNLENVQGDERDVILFSPAYGPEEAGGPVHARFGPLGLVGGEKRLNVAVTRAKRGVVVFCSFDPTRLDVSRSKNVGPRLFAGYLRYVQAVSRGDPVLAERCLAEAAALGGSEGVVAGAALRGRTLGRALQGELAAALLDAGYLVERDLGLGHERIDLVVGRPGAGGLRVGLDCAGFASVADTLGRDVYGPRFWQRAGWRLLRLTPRMWREERSEVLARIAAALDEAQPSPAPRSPVREPAHAGS